MDSDKTKRVIGWGEEPGATPVRAEDVLGPGLSVISPHRRGWSQQGVHGFNSKDRRSRPFNLLRSQVSKIMQAKGWRILGVTSATPQVGKSFIAANLAASMSRLPMTHTLLFDLDLRRGSIAKTFGIEPGHGIESFLAGDVNALTDAAYEVAGGQLTIFPSFASDRSSSELLSGSRMLALVDAMKQLPSNVLCICDLPPAFANDDAAIVLRSIDAYLFVVEEGRTTERQIRDAMGLLAPAPCIGTVLNRYNGGLGSDDYGFGYGSSHGYDAYYS